MLMHGEMQIFNWRMKWCGAVVIAFHRENVTAESHFSHAHDERIRNVTAANQQISPQLPIEINLFFVRNNQCSHANIFK
jgi:hypothetical protein